MIVTAGFRRFKAAAVAAAIVVSGVLVGWAPVSVPGVELEAAVAAEPVAPPPLGVTGTPKGEGSKSQAPDDRVMVKPPSDAKPVNESLEDRLKRERDATPEPPVRGYDKDRSVEDPSGRSSHGTTYNNVDGTQTTILDDHAVHYQANGRWEKVDPAVAEAANGEWVTKANDHIAKFSTKWIELASGKGRIRTAPAGVVLPEPVVSADGLTVTYPAVWPGIDLRYRLLTDGVKEEVVVSSAAALPTDGRFAFDVTGPGLKLEDGVPRIEGELGTDILFGGVEVFDRAGVPISTPAVVSLTVDGRRNGGGADKIDTLTIGVDPAWAAALPSSAFPIVVDPSNYWGPWIQNAEADSAAPGTPDLWCAANPGCNHSRVGNQAGGFGDIFWHTGVGHDYSAMLPTSTVASTLYSATLRLSYAGGTTNAEPIAVRHATSYGYCGTNIGGSCANGTSPYLPLQWLSTGYIDYNVHSIVNPNWTPGAATVGFALSSSENPGGYSYKELDTALILTYDRLPIITAGAMSPGNPHTFHSSASGVHLSINQLADPDLETLYYRFVLCTAGCTTIADDSGWDTIGSPDADPWDYYSSLWPPGPGLTAWFYNQQLYWTVMVSNSPTGAGFVSYAPQWNQWMLVNNCPAAPAMSDPAGTGAGGFVWAPNNPPTLTITPNLDPDGDWVRYRVIIREQGSTGLLYTSDWSASQGTAAPISHTLAADLSLQPGVTYEWSAEAQDDPTYFHWYHYQGAPCSAASSFRKAEFEARLGAGGPSPTQTLGPVSVNLATGNVTTAVTTPQVATLGGSMGASMSYNSRANDIGLQARLYNDTNNNTVPEAGELATSRVDREMSFKWATPGAAPGISNFVGTWTGYLTVPAAGTYHIAAAVGGDERVEVKVGTGYTLQANYVSPAEIPFNIVTGWTPPSYVAQSNVTVPAGGFTASAWQVFPITITYRNPAGAGHLALYLSTNGGYYADLPITWLSPEARILPRGWTFNHLDGAGAAYTKARVEATEIVLTRPDGAAVAYTRNSAGGYAPPPNEDDIVTLVNNLVTVTDTAGNVHQFGADGQLTTVTAPLDTKSPAAPQPVWTSITLPGATAPVSRMTALTDPVSGRQVTFKYQGIGAGTCPGTSPWMTPPDGMLCQITYPDGSATKLYYLNDLQGSVQLGRVENPGDATLGYPMVDFGYNQVSMPAPSGGTYTVPLLSAVRDPLANDALAAGQITASADWQTDIAYDANGRVTSVTAPKPSSTSTFRQQVFIDYQTVGGVTFNETRTRILGLDNTASSTDWDRKVEFDSVARTTREYQAVNATSVNSPTTEYGWDGNTLSDRLLWIKANRQITRTVYTPEGWVSDTYGPANETCFDGTTKLPNNTCTNPAVPHTTNTYDGGMTGLSVTVFPNQTWSGPPSNMATGLAGATSLSYNWGAGGPAEATNTSGTQLVDNFSMRLTGTINFPTTGTYTLSTGPDDVLNVYIDDTLVVAGTCCTASSGTFYLPPGSSTNRRIRLDYAEIGGGASFYLDWSGPGITGTVTVPNTALAPRYGLNTASTSNDTGGVTPSTTTTSAYNGGGLDPVYGLATSTTTGGLTTTTTYETAGYRRRTAMTLPAGNQTTYAHYTGNALVNSPCTTVDDTNVHQYGLLRLTVDPLTQTGKQVITEQVYDTLGRAVGSRRGTRLGGVDTWEATWSCTTYDTRQRPTTVTVPNATGTTVERTLTTSYAVGGDPRKTSVTDPAGTITTEVDLLGRMVRYTDVWGTVTANTYDATGEPGRLSSTTLTTSTAVLAATHTYDYDRAGRLSRQYLDGSTIAIPTYNPAGNANEHTLASISYPSGTGNLGNNTSLAALGRNSNGAVTSQTWNQGTTAFFTNTVTRSRTGRVITDTTAGNTSSYEYDTAGRLIKATQPGHVYQYGYGAQTGCTGANLLANAGANTNRTSLIDNGTTIATSCYDTADRLVSTTQAGYTGTIAYDNHGNTTTLAAETLTYDGADRHTSTTANGVNVAYTRDVLDRIVARTSPGAGAIPVWRGAGTGANNASGSTSLTLARPTAAVANDMLLAVVTTAGATVTAATGWTQAGTTSNTGVRTTVFWRAATGADPANWAFTLVSSQKAAGQIIAYSGVHTTAPIDTTGTAATSSGTSHAAPRVMTTGANRVILTAASVAANTTFTPAASTTERVDTASTAGAPTISVEVAQHGQAPEAKTAQRTPTSAVAAAGAAMTIALRPVNSGTQTVRYSYSAAGDATTLSMTTANVVVDRTITLPGGLTLTRRSATHNTWAYPNIHGDTTYTIDHNGQLAGPYLYDPYGNPLTGHAETSPGDFDNGWLGEHQRPTEHAPELRTTIEMGARPYRPEIGRFLRVDPIPGGATDSNYAYVEDPINQYDLTGMFCMLGKNDDGSCRGSGVVKKVRKLAENPVSQAVTSALVCAAGPVACAAISFTYGVLNSYNNCKEGLSMRCVTSTALDMATTFVKVRSVSTVWKQTKYVKPRPGQILHRMPTRTQTVTRTYASNLARTAPTSAARYAVYRYSSF